jgi:hypothetical protein
MYAHTGRAECINGPKGGSNCGRAYEYAMAAFEAGRLVPAARAVWPARVNSTTEVAHSGHRSPNSASRWCPRRQKRRPKPAQSERANREAIIRERRPASAGASLRPGLAASEDRHRPERRCDRGSPRAKTGVGRSVICGRGVAASLRQPARIATIDREVDQARAIWPYRPDSGRLSERLRPDSAEHDGRAGWGE